MAVTSREAVKVAQAILRRASPSLVPDGWWGTFTNNAYLSADASTRAVVDSVLRTAGLNVERVMQETRVVSRDAESGGDGWIPEDKLRSIIDRVAQQVGLDPDLLLRFVRIEAAQKVVNGTRLFNAHSMAPSGLFKGLFQMGKLAWTDVQRRVRGFPDYSNWKDPYINALAGAQYIKINMDYARDKGYSGQFTPEVLYAMHNQGAAGFMRLLRERTVNKNVTNQSKDAQRIIRLAAAQAGVSLS